MRSEAERSGAERSGAKHEEVVDATDTRFNVNETDSLAATRMLRSLTGRQHSRNSLVDMMTVVGAMSSGQLGGDPLSGQGPGCATLIFDVLFAPFRGFGFYVGRSKTTHI